MTQIYLAHCGLSPLYSGSQEIMHQLIDIHAEKGDALFRDHYIQELDKAKSLLGQYLNTSADNMALVKNTTEALSMVANGYPWEDGDEVILYSQEYPANYYPWINLQQRGVKIRTLDNDNYFDGIPDDLPGHWNWEDLESKVSSRTRMIVMSHVQFVSGYAADLEKLGGFCRERGIEFIIDGAQSLGALPIDVKKYHISALSGSGWKWLRGPMGIAPFFTSPELREKLALTVIGAETMEQGTDFLNHVWNPHKSARRYEYATSPVYLVAGLNRVVEEVFLGGLDPVSLAAKLFHLQDHFLDRLEHPDFIPLKWPNASRSGILSLYHPQPNTVEEYLRSMNIVTSARGGYLRVAAHYYNTKKEMEYLAEMVNEFHRED